MARAFQIKQRLLFPFRGHHRNASSHAYLSKPCSESLIPGTFRFHLLLYFNFVCFATLDDKLDGANLHSDVRDQKRVGHLSLF
jgi:hypothetical protein